MKHNYLEKLSKRELAIAGLTAKGFSAKEVADRLHISPLTVQTHIRNIYQKCGARKNKTGQVLSDEPMETLALVRSEK